MRGRGGGEVGAEAGKLGACALAACSCIHRRSSSLVLLRRFFQQPQLPLLRLPWTAPAQHFLQVHLGLRLIPHLGVSPGPPHSRPSRCLVGKILLYPPPGRRQPHPTQAAGLHWLAQPLTLAMMTLSLSCTSGAQPLHYKIRMTIIIAVPTPLRGPSRSDS